MRPRRRRPARTAAALAAVAVAVAGCVQVPDEPVVVSVFFHSGQGAERDTFDEQVQAFNAAHRTQVSVEVLPEGEYDAAVVAAAEAGTLPCLLDLDGPYLQPYVDAGYLQPLDDLVDDDLRDDLLGSVLAGGTAKDGRLYALGVFDSGLAIWGNRDQLDRAGVRVPTGVDDAWDLAEFEQALADLQALPEVEHALDMKLNYGPGEWFTYGFSPIVWGFGGDLVDTSGDVAVATGTLDGPATVAALTWLAGLVEAGYVDPAQSTDDDFHVERSSALSWVGHWMWESHRDGLGDDLVLLPMPRFPQAQVTGLGSWQWGITSGCEHVEETWEFLATLLEPGEVLRMTRANGAVPSRLSAIEQSPLYRPDAPLGLFVEQLALGIARPRPATGAYREVTAAFAEAVDAVLRGAPVQESLSAAAARVDGVRGDG